MRGRFVGWLSSLCVLAGALFGLLGERQAAAAVRRVPEIYRSIQAAVDAARPGDAIEVGPGVYCGATIDKPLSLIGRGQPAVIGCADGPSLFGGVRIGFYLPGADGASPASGTRIDGFLFDGRGVSETNLDPLGLGVFARFARDIRVEHNVFLGTVQAITDTAGDGWLIAGNRIAALAVFDCTGSLCAGGDGIVVQVAPDDIAVPGGAGVPANRPKGNVILDNQVEASIPDGFDTFSFAGIFLLAGDDTLIARNEVAIPQNPAAGAEGDGILIANVCCGEPALTPGARRTVVIGNDGRRSQFAIAVEGDDGANTAGLVLRGNLGTVDIEGTVTTESGPPHPRFTPRRHHHPFF